MPPHAPPGRDSHPGLQPLPWLPPSHHTGRKNARGLSAASQRGGLWRDDPRCLAGRRGCPFGRT
eukprot:1333005-Pyramimonas_sp.AAC.1